MLKRRIDVDFTKKSGKIKPVNGVCTGPFFGDNIPDFANEYRELAIPAVLSFLTRIKLHKSFCCQRKGSINAIILTV